MRLTFGVFDLQIITFRIHLYEFFQVEFQSENDQIMQGLLLLFDMLSRWRQE